MNRSPIVTIGIFDGVHIGHQRIIRELLKRARKAAQSSAVITFAPHPLKIIYPKLAPPLLLSLEHRLRLFFELGVDSVFVIKFTKSLRRMSAPDFVKEILVEQFKVKEVIIGEDFVFGHSKKGNCNLLKELGKRFNFKVTSIKEVKIGGLPVSSTRIRSLIEKGNLAFAKRLLGREVSVLGSVIKGRSLGRRIGFPTANIQAHHEVIPPSGVYAVRAKILSQKNKFLRDSFFRNFKKEKRFDGVLNIGFRPTLSKGGEPSIELHLFDFQGSLYGKDIEVDFIKKIREEKRFKSLQELKEAIIKDIQAAKRILSHPISRS